MASIYEPHMLTFLATAAAAKGTVVKHGADLKTVAAATSASDKSVGVLQSAPDVAGAACEVAVAGGGAKALAGAAVALGDLLTSDASGRVVPAVSGDRVIGVAMEVGAVGDLISIMVAPSVA